MAGLIICPEAADIWPLGMSGHLLTSRDFLYRTLVLSLQPEPLEKASAQRPAPKGEWALHERDHGTRTIQEKQISQGQDRKVLGVWGQ